MKAKVVKRKMFADMTALAHHNFTWACLLLFEYNGMALALTLSPDGRNVLVFPGFHLDGTEDLSEEFDIPETLAEAAYNFIGAKKDLENFRGHIYGLLR